MSAPGSRVTAPPAELVRDWKLAPFYKKYLDDGGLPIVASDKVADAVGVLADNGYPDSFVDLMYVATGTDAHLEWVERLLARWVPRE